MPRSATAVHLPPGRLKALRTRAKATQRQIADVCGVAQQVVSKWESGDEVPQRHLAAVAELLGVDVSDLVAHQAPALQLVPSALGGGASSGQDAPATPDGVDHLEAIDRRETFLDNLTKRIALPLTPEEIRLIRALGQRIGEPLPDFEP